MVYYAIYKVLISNFVKCNISNYDKQKHISHMYTIDVYDKLKHLEFK